MTDEAQRDWRFRADTLYAAIASGWLALESVLIQTGCLLHTQDSYRPPSL
jgi:hypothetical protein